MHREVATEKLDRPHDAVEQNAEAHLCACGRPMEHELHGVKARELAADTSTPTLVTEKGT